MTWVREGECCRCGECCWGVHGSLVDLLPQQTIEGACPHLRCGTDGIFACTGRDSHYYLTGCNVWPQSPLEIEDKPSCSYTFVWVPDADQDVVST